ncbi:hypothetical protein C8R47DRAFT_1074173 [Mycena vitilis]|nr:hypothetical protein C8R47DRAFT_1074173 [Mycena vitilis]
MMDQSSGFILVAGQVVQGNVDNTSTPGVPPQLSHAPSQSGNYNALPPPTTWDESSLSESENYCSQLLRQKRGLPLYIPDPQTLPAEHREYGIHMGDVGSVTPDGEFELYFNILRPAEHPVNAGRTPEHFSPMEALDTGDILRRDHDPGYYLCTSTVRNVDLDPPGSEFPGGRLVFSCDGPRGAVLALPYGAHIQDLRNIENIRKYAAKHADTWYKYINGPRGRGLKNGDLYLVTGTEKTCSWGMASYQTVRDQFRLVFRPTAAAGTTYNRYRWGGFAGQENPSIRKSHDPPAANNPWNQTTFIRGLSISLPTGLWGRLFGEVQTVFITDFQSLLNTSGGPSAVGTQSSLFSWALDLVAGGGTNGGKRHAGEQNVVLSSLSPPSTVFDPAKLINEYILHKVFSSAKFSRTQVPMLPCPTTMIGVLFWVMYALSPSLPVVRFLPSNKRTLHRYWKRRYLIEETKSRTGEASTDTPVKRGRGRPQGSKHKNAPAAPGDGPSAAPRRRGRPPKDKKEDDDNADDRDDDGDNKPALMQKRSRLSAAPVEIVR